MDILGSPESAVGNVDIDSKTGARATIGWVGLRQLLAGVIKKKLGATHRAKANRRVNTLLGHDHIVKLRRGIALAEETALDSTILLRRPSTNTVIKKV
jgi:hypothetical protein